MEEVTLGLRRVMAEPDVVIPAGLTGVELERVYITISHASASQTPQRRITWQFPPVTARASH